MMAPVHRLESAVLSAAPIILVCRPPPRGHRRQGPAPPPRPARPNPRSPGPCAGRPGPRSTGCAPPRRPAWSCPAPLRSGPMRRRRPGPTGRPTGGRDGRRRTACRGGEGVPPPQFVVADDGGGQGVLALQVVRRRHAATVLSGPVSYTHL